MKMNLFRHPGFAVTLALLAGCNRTASEAKPQTEPPAPPATAPQAAAASGAAAASLDGRKPLPLTAMMANHQLQEMRDHLQVVQEIAIALGKDDFDAIATSAARIAWSDKQAMMCKHMGAGAPGFTELGEHFHRTADGIVAAAKKRDRAAVATALGTTLETCVGCHATYRQQIVDEPAFAKQGGSMDHSKMHGVK
jgi:cytochrome c556